MIASLQEGVQQLSCIGIKYHEIKHKLITCARADNNKRLAVAIKKAAQIAGAIDGKAQRT